MSNKTILASIALSYIISTAIILHLLARKPNPTAEQVREIATLMHDIPEAEKALALLMGCCECITKKPAPL